MCSSEKGEKKWQAGSGGGKKDGGRCGLKTYKTSAQYTNKRNCSRKTWKAEVGSEVVHAGEMCMSTL